MAPTPSFLIAEGDPSLRQLLADITAEHFPGAAVYLAEDEAEALAMLPRLRPPCVAVLHWSLLASTSTLVDFHNATIPVLLTSAWDSRRVGAAGPATVRLQKPFDLHVYVERLKELLAKWPDPAFTK